MKSVAIVQSNYIPWKGYFDMINAVDEFVLFDDVQYTVRDWRNRNKIKVPGGTVWLSVPVEQERGQRIRDARVASHAWIRKHLEAMRHSYSKAPHFASVFPAIERLYAGCEGEPMLSRINRALIVGIADILGIRTAISTSMDYAPEAVEPTERLVELCRKAGADAYLTGPSAADYLDTARFEAAGVEVRWMRYDDYPEYAQVYPPFTHAVSVVDPLFHLGPDDGADAVCRFPRLTRNATDASATDLAPTQTRQEP